MATTGDARSRFLAIGIAAAVAVVLGGGLWFGLDDDDEGCETDPYRNAVSDKRAPKITVTVRDDAGQSVADIAYTAPEGRIPMRATMVHLQTLNKNTWSTTHSLTTGEVVECVPEASDTDAVSGPGPDTYPLPHLDPNATYRICLGFMVSHTEATGCSTPFHGS